MDKLSLCQMVYDVINNNIDLAFKVEPAGMREMLAVLTHPPLPLFSPSRFSNARLVLTAWTKRFVRG